MNDQCSDRLNGGWCTELAHQDDVVTATSYAALAEPARADVRACARRAAADAGARYADLLAAEAGLAARSVFPDVVRLVLRAEEDPSGTSMMLVAAYSASGEQLWHIERDDEWPDETQVTDRLAAAWDWSRGQLFLSRDGDGLCEFTVAT